MALTAKKVYAILKRQISDMEAKLNSPVRYRGTVATADLLPLNPDIGDMYNIESKSVYGEAGMNVAWNGVVWDTMGAPIDMSLYLTKEEAETVMQRLVTEYFEKNPVKPGATTEQAQQIEQNKTDIASLKTETGSLKEDISTKIAKFYASSQGETHLADSDSGKIMDMMLYGKSEQKQYSGDNIYYMDYEDYSQTYNGARITSTKFGYSVSGTISGAGGYTSTNRYITLAPGTYKMLLKNISALKIGLSKRDYSAIATISEGKTDTTFTLDEETEVCLTIRYSNTTSNETNEIMLTKNLEATSYEPYTGGIPSPNPDYPQEIKSVVNPTVKLSNEDGTQFKTVALPYTLNAIPVNSGGNVTIDGQQYIADYVDVERGKLVRMVGECVISDMNQITRITTNTFFVYGMDDVFVISDNSDDIARLQTTKYQGVALVDRTDNKYIYRCWLSTHDNLKPIAFHSNTDDLSAFKNEVYGTRIIYQLANPTEIDLAPEEIAAFKSLATYYPVTNIFINSEQLDGYTVFNYPISMENGWNYVKQQIGDTRNYIYDMDARTQDTDLQAAEAYVNSEYAVALTELEV
jgi:hypothetical protein